MRLAAALLGLCLATPAGPTARSISVVAWAGSCIPIIT